MATDYLRYPNCSRVCRAAVRFYGEVPPLNESFWKNAVRNPYYRPVKQQLTVRLDADVVAWLRQQGRGYQTRLNKVLREAMLEDIKKSA